MRAPHVGVRRLALAAAFATAASAAAAQTFPSKPIQLIVTTAPSGITDILARITADHVGKALDTKIVVENRTAGAGNPAIAAVAKSAPDGHTLMLINVAQIACNPWLYKDVQFDTVKDLAGIAPVGTAPSLLVVNDKLPAQTGKELVALIKASPGKYNYGSPGNTTMPHIVTEQFKHQFGLDLAHIPYRGGAPTAMGLATNEVQVSFLALGSIRPQLQSGQVRVLGVVSDGRLEDLPAVPTFDEAGLAGFDLTNWFGVMGPTGLPADVVGKLNGAVRAMLADPAIKARLREVGVVPLSEAPDAFNSRIRSDHEKYGGIIRTAGIKVQ
ncbi:MAG: Bug family tripartite tricarboxylate transporter substrate binding protein [Rhodospirillales bacterium]